jgi:hypothetical protein
MGLETPWGAWQLNEVTLMVGRRVENNLNNKKDAWEGFSSQRLAISGQLKRFRSAKGRVSKKVTIKADGTW